MSSFKSFVLILLLLASVTTLADIRCDNVRNLSESFALEDFSLSWIEKDGQIVSCASDKSIEELPFEAASLSKPIFAVIVLQLIEKGEFELGSKISQIVSPEKLPRRFQGIVGMPEFEHLTIQTILTHRTGLPNWRYGSDLSFNVQPNESFTYSGEAFELLQSAIEIQQQATLEVLAQKMVFSPLNMNNTSYLSATLPSIQGRNAVGATVPLSRTNKPSAAFSLVTTSTDYLKFMTAVATGKLLSNNMTEKMLIAQSEERDDNGNSVNWGLGVLVDDSDSEKVFAHTGSNPGFRALAIINNSATSGLVYLSNSDRGSVIDQRLVKSLTKLKDAKNIYNWLECNKCDEKSQLVYALEKGNSDLPSGGLSFDDKTEIAYMLAEAGRSELSQTLYDVLNKEKKDDIEILYGKAVIALRKSKFESANHYLSEVLEINPEAQNAKAIKKGIDSIQLRYGKRFFIKGYENADSVYIRGAFNDWNRFSLPMKRVANGWERFVLLTPGEYEYFYQVDNEWVVDVAASPLLNRFGKQISVIEVGLTEEKLSASSQ